MRTGPHRHFSASWGETGTLAWKRCCVNWRASGTRGRWPCSSALLTSTLKNLSFASAPCPAALYFPGRCWSRALHSRCTSHQLQQHSLQHCSQQNCMRAVRSSSVTGEWAELCKSKGTGISFNSTPCNSVAKQVVTFVYRTLEALCQKVKRAGAFRYLCLSGILQRLCSHRAISKQASVL